MTGERGTRSGTSPGRLVRLAAVCAMLPIALAAQAGPAAPACYGLDVGPWRPPFGRDSIFHRIPRIIRLDTTTIRAGARRLEPNMDYPGGGRFPGTPRWGASGDTIRLMWSNGFTPTPVVLVRRSASFVGEAIAESDAHSLPESPRPRASVTARPIGCPDSLRE